MNYVVFLWVPRSRFWEISLVGIVVGELVCDIDTEQKVSVPIRHGEGVNFKVTEVRVESINKFLVFPFIVPGGAKANMGVSVIPSTANCG